MKVTRRKEASAQTRVLASVCIGLAMTAVVVAFGDIFFAPITLFDISALVYGIWVWVDIWPMDAASTAEHALREDPSRIWADVFLILASLVSLVAVGFLIAGSGTSGGAAKLLQVGLGVLSVIISWSLVHTIYALRYARTYYGKPEGGIDFSQKEKPAYPDFAYLAFTIGMTFQVSDTQFRSPVMRKIALRHSLLAYIFGTIIVATTINLVAGLSK